MSLKYNMVADAIRNDILKIRYTDDRTQKLERRLPTESELMRRYQVSRQTVRQALSVLLSEGLIEKRQGSGTYISDRIFSSVASRNVAILTPHAEDYVFSAALRETQGVFSEAGYHLQVFSTDQFHHQERRILQNLMENPVAGILVQGTRTAIPNPNTDLYRDLKHSGTEILFLGKPYNGLQELPHIQADYSEGAKIAAKHLISIGRQHIGGIFRSDDQTGPQRYLGCVRALLEQSHPFDDRDFIWYTPETSRPYADPVSPLFLQFFIRHRLPACDGIICQNDEIAYLLIRELQRQNIQVPEQVSVIGFGNSHFSDSSPIRITTVTLEGPNAWSCGAQSLLQLLRGQKFFPPPPSWKIIKKASD